MFKCITNALAIISLLATPALAKGGFSSGGGYSRSSGFSSGSSYTRSYTSQPRFTSGPSYNYRPAQTATQPIYRSQVVQNYYHPPVVQSYYHGTFSSPWFWMWAMDRHQAPVVVQGGAQQLSPVVQDTGPGFFGMIFWGMCNLLILVAIIMLIVWLVKKYGKSD